MTKIELNKKIAELAREWFYLVDRKKSNGVIQKIVDLCDPYLQKHPHDTDIWIKLALAVYVTSYSDDIKAIECMNTILSYDPLNTYALIILAYIESNCWHGITDETFEKLCFVHVDDNEVMSMIEYIKSWYYAEHKNEELQQQSLEKSIALCQNHVSNYINLAGMYTRQGKIVEGEKLKAIGLSNIKEERSITTDIKYFDITDINHFLEERIQ